MNHTHLESMFRKKHTPHIHIHKTRHIHAHHAHTHDLYAHVCTLHIVDVRTTLQKFFMIEYIIQILQTSLFGLGKVLTPMAQKGMGTKIHPNGHVCL